MSLNHDLKYNGTFLEFFRAFSAELQKNPNNGISPRNDFIDAATELLPKDMENICNNFASVITFIENEKNVPADLRNFAIVQIQRYVNERLVTIQTRLFAEMEEQRRIIFRTE